MDREQESEQFGLFPVLKTFAEISIVLGAALFLIGWSYLYGYYKSFGLSASELSFSPQVVLLYSLPVIQTSAFVLAFSISILIVVPLVLRFVRVLPRFYHPTVILVLVLLAGVYMSRYASKTGSSNASRDAFLSTSTLPLVKLQGPTETEITGCSLDEWNYLLVGRTNGQIYVAIPIDTTKANAPASLRVCSFPESRIQAVRIQVGFGESQ